jgi:hypothetical protein
MSSGAGTPDLLASGAQPGFPERLVIQDPSCIQGLRVEFSQGLRDRNPRQSTGLGNLGYSTIAKLSGFTGSHQPSGSFIKMRPDESELLLQNPGCGHENIILPNLIVVKLVY